MPAFLSCCSRLELPLACVLGNHDAGKDGSGRTLRRQLELLGERHCGWGLRELRPPGLAVVGARPGTAGGGFHLSKAVRAVYGPVGLQDSAERIRRAALAADPALPLVLLAHCGPSGLGSSAPRSLRQGLEVPRLRLGRSGSGPGGRSDPSPPAPAAGGVRPHAPRACATTGASGAASHRDRHGTAFLNTACVPRHGVDQQGRRLRHFSWVVFRDGDLRQVSHRWYGPDGALHYEQTLWRAALPRRSLLSPC